MRGILALGGIVAGLAVAGCGGDEEGSGPAAVTPASAPVYVDLSVRPEGEAKEGAEAALGKILDTDDPGQRLVELAQRVAGGEGPSFDDYEDEVEPWLGERLAVFLVSIGGGSKESKGAFVLETTDADQALELFRSSADATGRTREHEGVEYELEADGDVFGAVDDFIVGGDEPAFKAAVDASGGDALADSDQFTEATDRLGEDSLASLYLPPERFLEAIDDSQLGGPERDIVRQALGGAADQPLVGALTASAEAVSLELTAGGGGIETADSELLSEVPSEAWLAIGVADIGGAIRRAVEQIEQVEVRGLKGAALRRKLRDETGINLGEDVIRPLGDAALFVAGASRSSLGGALVVETKNPEASAELLGKLEDVIAGELPLGIRIEPLASTTGDQGFQISDPEGGLPKAISVIQRDERIIAGYGGAAVNQALAGTASADPISSGPAFKSAQEELGELGVDALLSIEPAIALAESSGLATGAGYEEIRPYLDSLAFLALGSGSDEDRSLLRLVLGLE